MNHFEAIRRPVLAAKWKILLIGKAFSRKLAGILKKWVKRFPSRFAQARDD